jgi:serine/threonine-protein kinase HipA
MLRVLLQTTNVGEITLTKAGTTEFRFLDTYLELAERPVLGQWFLDKPRSTFVGVSSRLPAFFRNLLPDPEGKHRAYVAQRLGLKEHQEFAMLARLGDDLPGALVVVSDGDPRDMAAREGEVVLGGGSVAGMQPKFSAVAGGGTLRFLPGRRAGNLIVKPPDADLEGIPENEFSMMRWAAASGLNVADVDLVPLSRLDDLPVWLQGRTGDALIVKRFDRLSDRRVHIEDMAQVWGLEPDQKYEQRHYLAIANLLIALGDRDGFDEFVRRLVFMVASGNSDAHLKNWSLIYVDGMRPKLSPAYDLVSVIPYPQFENHLALKLAGMREYADVSEALFRIFATKLGESPDDMARSVRKMADRVRDTWTTLRNDIPMRQEHRERIEKHWQTVPLLRA